MGTMTVHALTYTRDATTGPMLTGGRAEATQQGGRSGMILPPHRPSENPDFKGILA